MKFARKLHDCNCPDCRSSSIKTLKQIGQILALSIGMIAALAINLSGKWKVKDEK